MPDSGEPTLASTPVDHSVGSTGADTMLPSGATRARTARRPSSPGPARPAVVATTIGAVAGAASVTWLAGGPPWLGLASAVGAAASLWLWPRLTALWVPDVQAEPLSAIESSDAFSATVRRALGSAESGDVPWVVAYVDSDGVDAPWGRLVGPNTPRWFDGRGALLLVRATDLYLLQGSLPRVSAEIAAPLRAGVAVHQMDDPTVAGLVSQAREAAWFAANATVRFHGAQTEARLALRTQLSKELRPAIAGGELRPWFQPFVQGGTGRLAGVEVLVRWHHSTHGVLGPDAFMPLTTQRGVGVDVGRAVVRKALADVSKARARGTDVGLVAFNLAEEQLTDRWAVLDLVTALHTTELGMDRMRLEVPWRVIAHASDAVAHQLELLGTHGLHIVADGFCGDVEDLIALSRHGAGTVKLDARALRAEGGDPALKGYVEVARTLGLAVHLAYVETAEDVTRLSGWTGVSFVQGFGVASPRQHPDAGVPAQADTSDSDEHAA